MEGVLARAAAKRRPSRDLKVGRQIRSFTYQFAKDQNNAKNACLIRHGPSSSPNVRGAGSVEKDIKLFYARLSGITKIDRTLIIMKREYSNKLRERNIRENITNLFKKKI